MTERPRNLETDSGTAEVPKEERPPGMPRWVKVGIIAVALIVLVIVVLTLTGGHSGGPGPGGH